MQRVYFLRESLNPSSHEWGIERQGMQQPEAPEGAAYRLSAKLAVVQEVTSEEKPFLVHPPLHHMCSYFLSPLTPPGAQQLPMKFLETHRASCWPCEFCQPRPTHTQVPCCPPGSSGQLPLRVTRKAQGENPAPINSWLIPGMPPPYEAPWADCCVFC